MLLHSLFRSSARHSHSRQRLTRRSRPDPALTFSRFLFPFLLNLSLLTSTYTERHFGVVAIDFPHPISIVRNNSLCTPVTAPMVLISGSGVSPRWPSAATTTAAAAVATPAQTARVSVRSLLAALALVLFCILSAAPVAVFAADEVTTLNIVFTGYVHGGVTSIDPATGEFCIARGMNDTAASST